MNPVIVQDVIVKEQAEKCIIQRGMKNLPRYWLWT
jgi:hypothetical protein